MERMCRRGLEPEVSVELLGLVVEGVDQQGSHPDEFGGLNGAGDGVSQQVGAQTSPLFLGIDGEAPE